MTSCSLRQRSSQQPCLVEIVDGVAVVREKSLRPVGFVFLGGPTCMWKVVALLGDIGGRTLEETTRRIMHHVMSNDLAFNFNVCGRQGKRPFGKSKSFSIINRAAKRNPLFKTTTKDVEMGVSKWLIGARDRGGRRLERTKAEKEKRDAAAVVAAVATE